MAELCDIDVADEMPCCCKKALKEMDDYIKLGNIGSALTLTAPLLTWLGSLPTDIALQEATNRIATRKLDTGWPKAQFDTFQMLRFRACSRIAQQHLDFHQKNDRKDSKKGKSHETEFWGVMSQKFDYQGY
jgi:hypothetical protein